MDDDRVIKMAQKRVRAKKKFYKHFGAFIAVTGFFLALNVLTFDESGNWWFFFPILPWGVAILIHYFNVFGLPASNNALTPEWESEELEKEIKRLRNELHTRMEKQPEGLDLNEQMELKELEKEQDKRWREEDLV
ncbi:MAG TPA: 2TM domain-containing protein [Flavilitoribacter sp.]|nr:2TM domain-containing protein [Flavilitoribacter sp.]HMQ86663.1 2TM domain-containing protein [Flavilitoribacter sp.]